MSDDKEEIVLGCPRCKKSHRGAYEAPFKKSWRGQAAIQATVRAPNGKVVRVETDLSDEQYSEILRILGESIRAQST
jgi:hypothetical protein